jgi:hypothetical protein
MSSEALRWRGISLIFSFDPYWIPKPKQREIEIPKSGNERVNID